MKKLAIKAVGVYLNTLSLILPEKAGKHGFRFFCYPFRTDFKPHHKRFLETSEKFNFRYKETNIQVYKWGNGEKKVLFLHGWQSHSFRWKKYIEALPKEEYTLYSIDAPGHGASSGNILHVPIYSQVIQQFIEITGRFDTVVGHSMGGFSILHAVHHNPDLPIGKLVIMGTPGEGSDFVNYFQIALKLSGKTVSLTLNHFYNEIGYSMDYFSTSRFAGTIKIPGLIVHDKNDKEAPYKYAEMIKDIWKGSKLITTEGLTHNLKSNKVVAAVRDFILEQEGVEDKEFSL